MLCPLCQTDNSTPARRCRACGAPLKARAGDAATAPDALPAATLLAGTYVVESVLGQGGFGITYRCHDRMLDRPVAIKEFFPSGCRRQDVEVQASRGLSEADFRQARAQFLAEARVLARCHHVGIVGVHAAFEANETAYMVMELLHGQTLSQLLSARGGAMNEAEAVGIVERVGEALQFVHGQNLLHRDIKPDNIIVCDDGRVMLIDFGTARETIAGQVQGQTVVVTPGYAPLEQYAKQARRGAFTDIYSLAATLYHLLTGQMPPAASDRAMGVQLRSVREFNSQISPAVAAAVEAALQMEIARRPQNVREFLELLHAPAAQAEVESFFHPQIAGSPLDEDDDKALDDDEIPDVLTPNAIRARQSAWPREQEAANAQPVKLAPPSDFFVNSDAYIPANMNVAGGNAHAHRPFGDEDSSKKLERMFAGIIVFCVLVVLYGSMGQIGQQRAATSSSSSSNPSTVYPPPPRASSGTSDNDSKRQVALRDFDAIPVLLPVSTENLPSGNGNKAPNAAENSTKVQKESVEFSPDGKRLAYLDNQAVLRVLNVADRRVVRSIKLDKTRALERILFSPDDRTMALVQTAATEKVYETRWLEVWNVATGKRIGVFEAGPKTDYIWPQAVFNDGQVLLLTTARATEEKKMVIWNSKTGKRSNSPLPVVDQLNTSVLSPDGETLVAGSGAGRLQWFGVDSGKQKHERSMEMTQSDFDDRFMDGSFSRNSRPNAPLWIDNIRYSPDGSTLAARNDAEINVFDANANKLGSLTINGRSSTQFAIAPNGRKVATRGKLPYSSDVNLLWDVRTGSKTRLQRPDGKLSWAATLPLDSSFSPDGKQLYGVFKSGETFQFVTWNADATPIASFANAKRTAFEPAEMQMNPFVPITQSDELVALPVKSSIEIRMKDGTIFKELDVGPPNAATLKFSPGGQFLAARKFDNTIQIWDVDIGKKVAQIQAAQSGDPKARSPFGYNKNSPDMIFSPDNKMFACERPAGTSSVVELWSLEGQPHRLASLAQKERVNALAFSADGKLLACGGEQGLVQLVDVASRQIKARARFDEPVIDIVGTPQNWVVVGASQVARYRLEPTANAQLQRLSQFKVPVQLGTSKSGRRGWQWAVSADGQLLAMAIRSASLQIYDLSTGSLLQWLDGQSSEGSAVPFALCCSLKFSADGSQLTRLDTPMGKGPISVTTWSRTKTK